MSMSDSKVKKGERKRKKRDGSKEEGESRKMARKEVRSGEAAEGRTTADKATSAQKANKKPPKRVKDKTKKRKKKKADGTKAEGEVEAAHETVGQNRALRYLDAWKADRDGAGGAGWKFEKCRQIWLLQHCYDTAKIPDKKFDLLLEYMDTIKGRMRQGAIETAQKIVDLDESWSRLTEEGEKSEEDIKKELGSLPPSEKKAGRAKDVLELLSE